MITGNKGEWSEPYVLLKLLASKKLYLGKVNFQKIESIFYPILQIVSSQKLGDIGFTYEDNLVIVTSNADKIEIPIVTFLEFSKICLEKIKSKKNQKGAFGIPEIENFLKTIGILKIKEKSKVKNDITIQIEDPKTFLRPTLGFSIKSQLGGPSTLVNASNATNISYTLSNKISKEEITHLVSQSKFSEKFRYLEKLGIETSFDKIDNKNFNANLQTIDSNFPKIISEILLLYYQSGKASENTVENFTKEIAKKNPLNFDLSVNSEMYQMMIKRFLLEYALGMRAGEVWYREYEANGGYLVVKDDGEILCYHFYFIKHFEDYLFQNTKFETPSSGRYKMGEIYEEDGFQKLKLNLQIRFIK